ncbi:lysophospholipase [Pirellulaceae bacterium SH501]
MDSCETVRCTEDKLTLSDGAVIHRRVWQVEATELRRESLGRLFVVHGLGEHSGRYDALAKRLASVGWQVTAWDHRGHGLSSGKRGVIDSEDQLLSDLVEVLQAIQLGSVPGKVVILGHSLGGLLVARFLAEGMRDADCPTGELVSRIDSAILSSPALQIYLSSLERFLIGTLGRIHPRFTVSNGLNTEWICSRPEVVEAYRRDPNVHSRICGYLARFMLSSAKVVQEVESRWTKRTLCLYSKRDRCVDPAGAERFCINAPRGVVESYASETLLHEVLNEGSPEVDQQLERWLSSPT